MKGRRYQSTRICVSQIEAGAFHRRIEPRLNEHLIVLRGLSHTWPLTSEEVL